jgi:hypothetical protein
MSSTRTEKQGGLTRQDVFAILGSLGAIVAVITAVMLYFGWRRSDVQAQDMGIDVSLFDFSPQDYVIRSISSLYIPLLVIFGLTLGWLWLHGRVTEMLRRLAAAQPEVRDRAAPRSRVIAVTATAVAAACVFFTIATALSSPPWPIEPIKNALEDDQWIVPGLLIISTLTATYAFWLGRRLTERETDTPPRQVALIGAIVVSIVVLGAFWMLEEYASSIGHKYAAQIEANVSLLPRASVISPTPLGIGAEGVTEEVVQASGSTYYRTDGLRLLARAEGKLLLLPEHWTWGIGIVVVADRQDLIWEFSKQVVPSA